MKPKHIGIQLFHVCIIHDQNNPFPYKIYKFLGTVH